MIIQKNVMGEAHDQFYGIPQEQRIAPPAITDVAPSLVPPPAPTQPPPTVQVHSPPSHTDQPFTDPEVRGEAIEQGHIEPTF